MSSTPNWDEVFNREEYCSLCDQTTFMCDCDRQNSTDWDSMDDVDEN